MTKHILSWCAIIGIMTLFSACQLLQDKKDAIQKEVETTIEETTKAVENLKNEMKETIDSIDKAKTNVEEKIQRIENAVDKVNEAADAIGEAAE